MLPPDTVAEAMEVPSEKNLEDKSSTFPSAQGLCPMTAGIRRGAYWGPQGIHPATHHQERQDLYSQSASVLATGAYTHLSDRTFLVKTNIFITKPDSLFVCFVFVTSRAGLHPLNTVYLTESLL